MIVIKRILCPVDLSEDSERTIRYALALAHVYEAKLFLCHRPQAEIPDSKAAVVRRVKDLVSSALSKISGAKSRTNSIDWDCIILTGDDLGAAIIRAAAETDANLILMRSRRRPFAATLLGSTAETVTRQAQCTMLVMHADEREWMDQISGEIHLKRILAAFDFSDYSELAMRYSLALAQQYQAEIHLLHVLPAPVTDSDLSWARETGGPYQEAARHLQNAIPQEVHLWSKVKHAVKTGRAYTEILKYATENEIDLICMGAHGSDFSISSLLGSNVDRVLRQAKCPILVARSR